MTEASGIDRRQYPRFDLMAQIRVKRGSVTYVLELLNISNSGALIHTGTLKVPTWVRAHREIELHIIHPDDLEPVEVAAKIVRVNETDQGTLFAVHFIAPDKRARSGIARLLKLCEPSPPPLPRAAPG
jgi:c-di-GMP-binding flagellar brake protein YcgR